MVAAALNVSTMPTRQWVGRLCRLESSVCSSDKSAVVRRSSAASSERITPGSTAAANAASSPSSRSSSGGTASPLMAGLHVRIMLRIIWGYSLEPFERGPQSLIAAVRAHLHGAHRQTEDLGHLGEAQLLEPMHRDDLALSFGQAFE